MLDSVKIARRQSEIRQQLAGLVGKDNPTDEETRSMEALDAEYRSNETRYRAALIAEDSERREAGEELETRSGREWAELVANFEMRQVVAALEEGRSLSGQTAEIVQEMRSQGGYRGIPVPLAALEQRELVAGTTTSADSPKPVTVRPMIDRIFPASVASRLGGEVINITQGAIAIPVATAGAVAGWAPTEGANVPGPQKFGFTERMLEPDHTLGVHMRITRKALKQAGDGLEQAIRRDMNAAVQTELDRAILMGSGANGEPLGIITGADDYGIAVSPVDAAASWAAFRAAAVAFMDGNLVKSPGDIRMGFNPEIWADLDDALIAGTAVSQWDRLVKHIPAGQIALAPTLPEGTAVLTTNTGGIAPFYVGIWGGLDLIRDPYSDAQNGTLRLTALMTADVTVARGSQLAILTGLAGV
ncbi:phage major capsid protein [Paracoccus chinensis]|uniref:Phage major capsid protein, HK97 family n=1 Tax=Paracoccus chinensis TaxID=525640 RepID=A0A1G9N046_9RHOB|nr:phage major capsid protein [Paracoccus chinensis]SDL79902.1 phage major capsid protein, HK97 family [Paracoccus chinensis]